MASDWLFSLDFLRRLPPDANTSYWTVEEKPVTHYGDEKVFTATYNGGLSMTEFKSWWKSLSAEEIAQGAEQLAA